jgi:hypothetical protein
MTDIDEYKQWILSADTRSLLQQLNSDVKTPLVTAQNLVTMMQMMQNPSPAIQKKIESGELNFEAMLGEIAGYITQVFDVIDFYRSALDES